MFDNLLESKPKRQRSVSQMILSVVLHVVLIFVAVKATQGAAEAVKAITADSSSFLIPPPPPPPPPPPETPPPDAIVTNNPPPKGFQTLVPPKDLPTEIPPVDLNEKFDAKDFSGVGVEGGVQSGVVGGVGPVTDKVVSSQAFTLDEVDSPAQRTGGPVAPYPEGMRMVGIDGDVRLRFIVGTNGRAEPGSIQVMSSTNKAFEAPAKKTIRDSQYRPAQYHGKPVRQVVEQTIHFTMDK